MPYEHFLQAIQLTKDRFSALAHLFWLKGWELPTFLLMTGLEPVSQA
jgi:hypothetical protein